MRRSVVKVGPFACLLATLAIVLLSQQPVEHAPQDGGTVLGRAREVVSIVSLGDDDVRQAVRERADVGPTLRSGLSVVLALVALAAPLCRPAAVGRVAPWAHGPGARGRSAGTRGRAPPAHLVA